LFVYFYIKIIQNKNDILCAVIADKSLHIVVSNPWITDKWQHSC